MRTKAALKFIIGVLAPASVAIACSAGSAGGDGLPDAAAPTCTEGASVACTCTSGAMGAQVCSGGALGECSCAMAGGSTSGGNGGADAATDAPLPACEPLPRYPSGNCPCTATRYSGTQGCPADRLKHYTCAGAESPPGCSHLDGEVNGWCCP